MLKIVCDAMCGYVDRYVIDNNYEFNLSFLTNRETYIKYFGVEAFEAIEDFPTQEGLYLKYKDNVKALLTDFSCGSLLMSTLASTFGLRYFPEVFDKEKAPIIFPELIKVTNLRLVYNEATEEVIAADNNVDSIIKTILDAIDDTIKDDTDINKEQNNKNKKYDA